MFLRDLRSRRFHYSLHRVPSLQPGAFQLVLSPYLLSFFGAKLAEQ